MRPAQQEAAMKEGRTQPGDPARDAQDKGLATTASPGREGATTNGEPQAAPEQQPKIVLKRGDMLL